MTPIDYKALLQQALSDYGKLLADRQELDLELAKKKQFIRATMNMLPDEDREEFNVAFEVLMGDSLGLTDAIRRVLQSDPKKPFTATEVRDRLKNAKFDFSSYKTNPLASIHAVLKRLKPEEVEATEIDGVAAWRWVGEVPDWNSITRTWLKAANPDAFFSFGQVSANSLTSMLVSREEEDKKRKK